MVFEFLFWKTITLLHQPSLHPLFLAKVLLNDDISLSLVYAAADVFIAPSVQDNLPNTVMESLACGTPCVAFDIGGMCDMIGNQQNGYLAKPFDIDDLAKGIIWVLEDEERLRKLGVNGRKKVEQNFTLEIQANNYLSVYQDT